MACRATFELPTFWFAAQTLVITLDNESNQTQENIDSSEVSFWVNFGSYLLPFNRSLITVQA